MYFIYVFGFSASTILPPCDGPVLDIALSGGIVIDGKPLARLHYRMTADSVERIVTTVGGAGSILSLGVGAAQDQSITKPRQGIIPAAALYFLCALANDSLVRARPALGRVLLDLIFRKGAGIPVSVSFRSLFKTYLFVETMGDSAFAEQPFILPMAEKIFQRACQILYGKSLKQLRYEKTLQSAMESLYFSDAPIPVVRERAGYSDTRSFQKAFKQAFGLTPETIRRY